MADRSERREEIKLLLEYAKILTSVIGVAAVIFVGLEWRNAARNAQSETAQKMFDSWNDVYLNTFT